MQAYTHKQAQHLVEIEDDPDSPALASLQRWSLEITAVFTCLSITNPRVMDILSVSSMDAELQSEPHPDTFYDDLLVSLSNASFTKSFFCTLRWSSPRSRLYLHVEHAGHVQHVNTHDAAACLRSGL